MKVLLNTTTLNKGGALQASASFVREALKKDDGIEWCFATSRIALDELEKFGSDFKGYRVEVFENTPARYVSARRKLKAVENNLFRDIW